jgi:hypothetical protein
VAGTENIAEICVEDAMTTADAPTSPPEMSTVAPGRKFAPESTTGNEEGAVAVAGATEVSSGAGGLVTWTENGDDFVVEPLVPVSVPVYVPATAPGPVAKEKDNGA